MILNQFLPPEELKNTLSEKQIQNLDFILDALEPKKEKPILKDIELMGQIHHSVNLDKYSRAKFRYNLVKHAPPQILEGYLKFWNITKNPARMSKNEIVEKIKKTTFFKWGNNDETKKFVDFFRYPHYIIPKNLVSKKTKEIVYGGKIKPEEQEDFQPLKMLLDYQAKIVYKALKKLDIPNMRFLIQMPTGTGKTRTAMDILAHIMNEGRAEQVIWLANRSELLNQAVDDFKHVWKHVGKHPIEIYKIWGNEKVPKIKNEKSVIFAGYDKLNNMLKKRGFSLKPDIIVLDEAHQILAPTYKDALDKLTTYEKETRVIGLSATPGRGIDKQQNELLVQTFHGNLIGIEFDDAKLFEQYEENIVEYLEDQDILAKAVPEPLETDFEYFLSEEEWDHLTTLYKGDHPDYTKEFLKNLAEDNKRNLLIVEKLKEYADKGGKILYFSTDLDQSVLVFAALMKLGINAIHVSAETDREFRKQIVKKFKESNEINVICNYDIFSTGFDVPNLDVIFIGRPVNSPVLFNQIVGRGTRGIKMGADKNSFTLVQVIDRISSGYSSFDPYQNYAYWDVNWKSR